MANDPIEIKNSFYSALIIFFQVISSVVYLVGLGEENSKCGHVALVVLCSVQLIFGFIFLPLVGGSIPNMSVNTFRKLMIVVSVDFIFLLVWFFFAMMHADTCHYLPSDFSIMFLSSLSLTSACKFCTFTAVDNGYDTNLQVQAQVEPV